jgi:hypothetical protein
MRTTKLGLLALSFAVAVSAGCTYNEDDLHAGHHDAAVTPGEDAPPATGDLPGAPVEPDGGLVSTDAETADLGAKLDTPATGPDANADVPAAGLDAGTELPDAADEQRDLDATTTDGLKDDASADLSKDVHGPDAGTSTVDGKLTEVGVDGTSG